MDTVLLTPNEIAATLKISKGLAYRLIAMHKLPAIRFGRTVRVKQQDLDDFILRNTSGADSKDSTAPTLSSSKPKEVLMT